MTEKQLLQLSKVDLVARYLELEAELAVANNVADGLQKEYEELELGYDYVSDALVAAKASTNVELDDDKLIANIIEAVATKRRKTSYSFGGDY